MWSPQTLILLLTLVLNRTKVLSFNIETRDPISKKAERLNTYFGFSVAQHAAQEGSTNPNDYWILVGAPLGKNLQPNTNRSGALYKCPMTKNQRDCKQVETDGKRVDDFDYEDTPTFREAGSLNPPLNNEIKEDQWLGVTVKSQKPGGKVVVCAHRYIQSPNLTLHHYGMGLCYLLNNHLQIEEALEPCKGQPMEKLHQQYGYCQVGTSLAVLEDGFAVMGSPGPYTWRGTIFPRAVGSFLDRDKTFYKGPLNNDPTPLNKYSYLGMSVTGGHFFDKNVLNYVSGAPRSNYTGQVFFFKKVYGVQDLIPILILNGTQFASSFGYEILAVDIDQDGYDELLVAAPFYYGANKGGAVYIYNNLRSCTNNFCEPVANLTGKSESRFGFAMTSVGDINKDGFNDVAIGAPYEVTGEAGGAVYIYLGQNNTLSKEPSQVIRHRGFKTIGYSMSGGLDMDLNGYPDLLVGAYESDMVVMYKTRPIIDIYITVEGNELKNINVTKKGCYGDPNSNKTCFSFKTCFSLSKFTISQPIDIRYEIKEMSKKIPRVTLRKKSEIFKVTDDRKKCREEVAYFDEANGDILTPIQFQVNYTIHDDKTDSPILNKTSIKNFEATFQKNCGPDDICKSNLTLKAGTLLTETDEGYQLDMGKDKEFVLEANVTNRGESAYQAKLFVSHPEGLSYIALQTKKNKTSNIICTSNNESTLVICNLGNPFAENSAVNLKLRFEITNTKKPKLDLNITVNSTSLELSKNTSQTMTIILQKIASFLIKGEGKPPNIVYSGEVKGQSAMKKLEDIGPRVVHTYTIINQGQWNLRGMSVSIMWPYQVYSNRKEGGKWLLYLEKLPTNDFNGLCTVYPNIVNPLKLNTSEKYDDVSNTEQSPSRTRRRRDVADVIKPENDVNNRKVVRMGCNKNTALCATIRCEIPQLMENSQVQINITARLWQSTLIEDYSQVDWVSIASAAVLSINDPTVLQSDNSIGTASIETHAYPAVVLTESGVNIWIIIGSVLAGLLLLIAVIVVLYKCGFFKRNRIKDHTLSANLKKQGESETLLKENEPKPSKKT